MKPPKLPIQGYEDVRERVNDGMLVFFKAVTAGQKVISTCTGGNLSHCGITTWMIDSQNRSRLMLLESTSGGCRLVNLSAYRGREAWIVDVRLDWNLVADRAINDTGIVHYSLLDFVMLGVKDISLRLGATAIARAVPNAEGEVCSEFLASTMRDAGFDIEDTLLSPQGLYTLIHNNRWVCDQVRIK